MKESAVKLRGLLLRTRSEEWLFDRAVRGDSLAFSEVYRRYQPRMVGYCLSRLLDPALAEEAAQETFVRLLAADPDSVQNPRNWLFGVARNVCLEMGRQRSGLSDAELSEEFVGTAADCADELARQEQGRTIILALRKMRPRYRTALVLRELHGLSSVEMAEALATTPGAVDTLVSRSRDAFGRAYSEVLSLPDACGRALPLIYKSHGTGLDPRERDRLDAHLETCAACRKEAHVASRSGMLAAILPLLSRLGLEAEPSRLMQALKAFDPALSQIPYAFVPAAEHLWVRTAATTALAVALALPVAPPVLGSATLGDLSDGPRKAFALTLGEPAALGEAPKTLAAGDSREAANRGVGADSARPGSVQHLARLSVPRREAAMRSWAADRSGKDSGSAHSPAAKWRGEPVRRIATSVRLGKPGTAVRTAARDGVRLEKRLERTKQTGKRKNHALSRTTKHGNGRTRGGAHEAVLRRSRKAR